MRTKSNWLIIGLIAAAGAAVGFTRHREVAALRTALDHERGVARSLEEIRHEHDRLLGAQPAAGELERTRAEGETLLQARAEVEKLRRQADTVTAEIEQRARPAERFVRGQTIPATEWKNAGTATPAAALETALWAGAGGDIEEFSKLITLLDVRAQKAAAALLDSLPEAVRAEYRTPERLLAFLTVKDVPLGSVVVRQSNPLLDWPMGAAHQMQMMLTQPDGASRGASLILLNRGEGWKLVVMEATVAKYAAQLKNAGGDGAGGK